MRIGINVSFSRKANTGIGQVTLDFLKKLIELKNRKEKLDKLEFILYLEEKLPKDIKLPKKIRQKIFLPIWKRDDLIRKIWWERFLLPKKAREDKCDVLISLYQCPTKTSIDMEHVMVVHDIIPKFYPYYLNNFRKKIYWSMTESAIKDADKIIAISKKTEKDLIHLLNVAGNKITTSYIDIDQIYKREVSENESDEILKKYKLDKGYIYHGGGLEVRKNAEGVLRAYKKLLEKNQSEHFSDQFPKLVISGKMMPQLAPLITDVEKIVKELGIEKEVRLLDFVPQQDLPALYRNASMFVFPSHYEGFGRPILEAMNQGVPVIASKNSAMPEVGLDSILYCHPDDPEDIAMVMKNILVNPDLQKTLSLKGKERAGYFSWEKFLEKLLNIVKNM